MIQLPLLPKKIKQEKNRAFFEIEALHPGYGVTVGNALRRVLLSSLGGAAVTQVKIENVNHEFSTIPNVLEDVVSIMLNLKQMRFKVFDPQPQRAFLKVRGERKVKGSDFKLPSQVELVNKSCHIATLTSKSASLEMEIQIEKGIGFLAREQREGQAGADQALLRSHKKLEIGVIPIDAVFSPVRKVSYQVKNMRVGKRTDFDKLILEIETDGTIEPENAFSQAADILKNHFSLFSQAFRKEPVVKKAKAEEKSKTPKKKEKQDVKKIKIEQLKISSRTINILLKNNIKTLAGLLRKDEKSLLESEGLGQVAVKEIKKALKKINLELKQ